MITPFGIATTLISDNGTQFVGKKFTAFISDHGIKHKKASVSHPQSNGQVEVTNRIILCGLQKSLTESKKLARVSTPGTLVVPHHEKDKQCIIIFLY